MIRIGKLTKTLIGLVTFLTSVSAVHATNIQVTSSVDRNELAVGESFTFTVKISSDTGLTSSDPKLPDLSQFELMQSWQGSESQSTFQNGVFQVLHSREYNYMFSAIQAGTFTINPASVQVDGKTYSTQPIKMRVLEGGQGRSLTKRGKNQAQPQPDEEDPMNEVEDMFNRLLQRRLGGGGNGNPAFRGQPTNPDESFFIQVEVDKKKAYVGEQVTASWYLYTRGQVQDIDTLKYPNLTGFWKEEIELATRLNFNQAVVNGIVYQKALLASYALFPIKAGSVNIDPYTAKCTISIPAAFGFSRPFQLTKSSNQITVQVTDIPKDNRPANFTGAVGKFQATARVDQSTAVTNQPMTVKIKYEGRGNAKLLDLPKLNLPATVEVYDTKNQAKFFREGTSYKEFELILVPRAEGMVTIPPISLSAFDPESGRFYEVATEPLNIQVLKGTQSPTNKIAESGGQPSAKAQEPQGPRLPEPSLAWESHSPLIAWPWLSWGVTYIGIASLLAWRGLMVGGFIRRRRDLKKILRSKMNSMKSEIGRGDWRKFGVKGTNLTYFILGQISGQGGASEELKKVLDAAPSSLRRELGPAFEKILERLQVLSFAPEGLTESLRDRKSLEKLAAELDQLLSRAIDLGMATYVDRPIQEKA